MGLRRLLGFLAACGASACGASSSSMPADAPSDIADALTPTRLVAYVSGGGPNIVAFEVDRGTGAMTQIGSTPTFGPSSSFLAIAADGAHLYAVSESTNRVGAYAIDRATAALAFVNDVAVGGMGPAHVAVDRTGHFVFVANYGNGTVSVFPVDGTGALGAAKQTLSPGTKAHQVTIDPTNRFAFVPCLGVDHVAQYTFDAATGMLAANAVPRVMTAPGAGPRHITFTSDKKFAYLINELNSTLTALTFDEQTGQLTPKQTLSTLPAPVAGNTGAEVVVDPSGKFVWGSNRGANTIATFAADASGMLSYTGATATTGMTPRNFAVVSDDVILVANQQSNSVVPFTIDRATGLLARSTAAPTTIPTPQVIGLVALPK